MGLAAASPSEWTETGGHVQHFGVLRCFSMVPRFCTFRMESGEKGTWHEVLPMSTVTGPI